MQMNLLIGWLVALVALNMVVFVHELGHWLFARLFGMRTPVFSIGFGAREQSLVLGRVWDTEFRLSPIPLGGYVQIGELDYEEAEEAETAEQRHGAEDVTNSATVSTMGGATSAGADVQFAIWKRACVMVAGVVFNVLFAFMLFFAVFVTHGQQQNVNLKVTELTSPTLWADVRVNDIITGVGDDVFDNAYGLSDFEPGVPVVLHIERGEQTLDVPVTPDQNGLVGVQTVMEIPVYTRLGLSDGLSEAASATFAGLARVVTGVARMAHIIRSDDGTPAPEAHSIIGIVQYGAASWASGVLSLVMFMITINVNLAVFNLLPLPILDGGRLVMLGVEMVVGRRRADKLSSWLLPASAVVLLGLMAWGVWNDTAGWMSSLNPAVLVGMAVAAGSFGLVMAWRFVKGR